MRNELMVVAVVAGIAGLGRAEPSVVNGSFEADMFTVYPGYVGGANGSISNWTTLSSSGLNPANGSNPFADNGWVPDGRNVAFIQQYGYLRQEIAGFKAGVTYRLTYYENARAAKARPRLEVRLVGQPAIVPFHEVSPVDNVSMHQQPYHRMDADFTVPADGTYTLQFYIDDTEDSAILIDKVSVAEVPDVPVANPSFEEDNFTVWPGYASRNGGVITGWSCTGTCGLNQVNGQYPFADNGAIPHGRNAAFMQQAGSISQTISGLRADVNYCLTYYENARAATAADNATLQVALGDQILVVSHVVTPVDSANIYCRPYHLRTIFFSVPADGSYVLSFSMITDYPGAIVIDDVHIRKVTEFVRNGSFEGNTFTTWPGYVGGNGPIDGWSYLSSSGLNPAAGTPFGDNGVVPDGINVAFIQQFGYLSQEISGLQAGIQYRLTYYENAQAVSAMYPALLVTLGSQALVPMHTITPVEQGGHYTRPYVKQTVDFTVPDNGTYTLEFYTNNSTSCAVLIDKVSIIDTGDIDAVLKNDLTRGRYLLLKRGLQIHGIAFPEVNGQVVFSTDRLYGAYFTGVNFWGSMLEPEWVGPAPGPNWGRCYTISGDGTLANLASQELPYLETMVTFQYGDEFDITDEGLVQRFKEWVALNKIRNPDVICHDDQAGGDLGNSAGRYSKEDVIAFIKNTRSDMTMFNSYPFTGNVPGGSPTNFYKLLASYRWIGLQGLDGTGNQPIPCALCLQTYPINPSHIPSESELRLNQFSAWAFGFTFADAFVYTSNPNNPGLSSILFTGNGDSSPTPKYSEMAETNRQSRNLGPALVRLISTDVRFIPGQHRQVVSQNLGSGAYTASHSASGITPAAAFDGVSDGSSNWNAGASAPQWIEVDLGQTRSIRQVTLYVQQSPTGRTRHKVYVKDSPIQNNRSGATLMTTFDGVTSSGSALTVAPTTAVSGRYVQVYTDISPSWVAWREVQVFVNSDNAVPSGVKVWSDPNRPVSALTSISNITNGGALNAGLPGDVIVGYFKPLHECLDGPDYSNQEYFMVVNGLTDANGTAAQACQGIRLNFSGSVQLQRMRRSDGAVETLPSGTYFDLQLDGGTGDLFKISTNAPFVGSAGNP